MVKIILGDEFDEPLKEALRVVLARQGAVGLERSWGVGGSQEIETAQVRVGEDVLTVESETFVGLTLSGPKLVVDLLAQQVRQQMKRA